MYDEMRTIEGGIVKFGSKGDKTYNESDFQKQLENFQLESSLKLISEVSTKVFESKEHYQMGKDFDVWNYETTYASEAILGYIAMKAIENCNLSGKEMQHRDLFKLCDMWMGLPERTAEDDGFSSVSYRYRNQSEYQRNLNNAIPRALLLFNDIWYTVNKADKIDPQEALIEITGLSLNEILANGLLFWNIAKTNIIVESNNNCKHPLLTLEKQEKFLDNFSCTPKQFKETLNKQIIPDVNLEKFRFNPLFTYPIIRISDSVKSKYYIAPIPKLIHYRSSIGLYHLLSDHFQIPGSKENKFKNAFGYVFQEYIKVITQKALSKTQVIPEFKYKNLDGNIVDSIDLILNRNGEFVFIEAKQSGLGLPQKCWADKKEIKKSLKQSIGPGVKQLHAFENWFNLRKQENQFNLINGIEKVTLSYDMVIASNSILKELIWEILEEENLNIPSGFHWHHMTIDEFEDSISAQKDNIYKYLKIKRSSQEKDFMDFSFYLWEYFKCSKTNQYLESIRDSFFKELPEMCNLY